MSRAVGAVEFDVPTLILHGSIPPGRSSFYTRLRTGGRCIAVVALALARRLAGILYAMWRDGTDFEPQYRKRDSVEVPPATAG